MLMVDISGKSRFLTVADPDDDTIHTVFMKQANDLSHHRPSPPPDPCHRIMVLACIGCKLKAFLPSHVI
jgi:hypothetical protein